MQKKPPRFKIWLMPVLAVLILAAGGCSSDSSEDLWTACGAVMNGEYVNPASTDDGELVVVTEVASESRIVIRNEDGETVLVKLMGVKDVAPDKADPAAIAFLSSLPVRVYFFLADNTCSILSNGIRLVPGTLITVGGRSYGEELMRNGYGLPDDKRTCGSERVNNCYAALAQEGVQ